MFQNEFAIFLFLSDMSEKQESTINEGSIFTDSICRILKSQETTSLAKSSLTKQFIFHAVTNTIKFTGSSHES